MWRFLVVSPLVFCRSRISSWQSLVSKEREFSKGKWAFRGLRSVDYRLETSLERHIKDLKNCTALAPGDSASIRLLEVQLIYEFARSYHLYSGLAPTVGDDVLQWLSLMRHHRAPCRLLDFTYSFFIAAFFALEDLHSQSHAAVWAVNLAELENNTREALAGADKSCQLKKFIRLRDGESYRDLFMRRETKFVCVATPLRLNERLRVQQGLFLIPGDVAVPFMDNLTAVSSPVRKVVLDKACRLEVLKKLHQNGINRASLYPGLEGFAESLTTKSLILRDLQESVLDFDEEANRMLDSLRRL